MRKIFVMAVVIVCLILLCGCASSPVAVSMKDVNAGVMKNSLTQDGSLNQDFKTRYAKLSPGMNRQAVFGAMGIPIDVAQLRLSSEEMRRILYGDLKMESFNEAEKLRTHVSSLCGASIPLESTKKNMHLTSPMFVATTLSGYRVWVDLIFRCESDELYYAQWRGNERLESGEKTAVWLLISGAVGVPPPTPAER